MRGLPDTQLLSLNSPVRDPSAAAQAGNSPAHGCGKATLSLAVEIVLFRDDNPSSCTLRKHTCWKQAAYCQRQLSRATDGQPRVSGCHCGRGTGPPSRRRSIHRTARRGWGRGRGRLAMVVAMASAMAMTLAMAMARAGETLRRPRVCSLKLPEPAHGGHRCHCMPSTAGGSAPQATHELSHSRTPVPGGCGESIQRLFRGERPSLSHSPSPGCGNPPAILVGAHRRSTRTVPSRSGGAGP